MDDLAIGFHIVYIFKSCKQTIFTAVRLGGDADNVTCKIGQKAGSVWDLQDRIVDSYKKYVGPNDNFKCARIAYLL